MLLLARSFSITLATFIIGATGHAGIIDKSSNVNDVIPIPADIRTGFLEDQTQVAVYLERENYALPAQIPLNFSDPGMYGKGVPPVFTSDKVTAGTRINSYYVHFDPVTDENNSEEYPLAEGFITFDSDIIGIIARSITLHNTNAEIGLEDTVQYPTGDFIGVEFGNTPDYVSISNDRRTITFGFPVGAYADNIRVITVPEIGTFSAVGGVALVGVAVCLLRRRAWRTC